MDYRGFDRTMAVLHDSDIPATSFSGPAAPLGYPRGDRHFHEAQNFGVYTPAGKTDVMQALGEAGLLFEEDAELPTITSGNPRLRFTEERLVSAARRGFLRRRGEPLNHFRFEDMNRYNYYSAAA